MLKSKERLSVTQFIMSALKFVVLAALVVVVSCRRITGGGSLEVSRRGRLLPTIENLSLNVGISGESPSSSGSSSSSSQETQPLQMRGRVGRKHGRTQLSSSTTESSVHNGFTRYWEREHHPRTQRPRQQRVKAVSSHEQEYSSGEIHEVTRVHHETDPKAANNGQQKHNYISVRGDYKSREISGSASVEQVGARLDNNLKKPYY